MRRNTLFALAVGLVLGLMVLWNWWQPIHVNAQGGSTPDRYEYRVERFLVASESTFSNKLNELATQGWEYVGPIHSDVSSNAATSRTYSTSFVVFRRLRAR